MDVVCAVVDCVVCGVVVVLVVGEGVGSIRCNVEARSIVAKNWKS